MQIYTSSWFTRLPPTIHRIGISRGTPRGQPAGYNAMPELAPGPWFKSVSATQYTELYSAQLAKLDPAAIVAKITKLATGKEGAALLCFEAPHKPEDWCHRGHVSRWLFQTLGLQVPEFGLEPLGFGAQHPKLPPSQRAPAVKPIDPTPYIGRRARDADGNTWEVVGRSAQHPDQAEVSNVATGEVRTVSEEVLKQRFGDQPDLI